MYWLAKDAQALRVSTIKRFDPLYWTVNFPRPMMASITMPAPNAMRIDARFQRFEDLAGVIWDSEDTLDHPLLRYETSRDYSNTLLKFRWRTSGTRTLEQLNGPTLTLEGRDENGQPATWFVRMWNYAEGAVDDAIITIDFNSVQAGFNLETDAQEIHVADIDRMFISIVPADFDGTTTGPLPAPVEAWAELTDIEMHGSGSVLEIGDAYVPPHKLRAATGYDDQFNQVPGRIFHNIEALGYRDIINHYVGMSHYARLAWDVGEGIYVAQAAAPYLNTPCQTWHTAFCEAAKARDMRVVLSLSFEFFNANCPDDWKQRTFDGSPALTGWEPPSSLLSPCNTAAMSYLHEVAKAFCQLAEDANCDFDFQCGEPWWWYQITTTQAPCFYDQATMALYMSETGQAVPTKHQTASETPDTAQLAYLNWLSGKLGVATLALRDAVKASYPAARQMLLFFTPQVLGAQAPLMAFVNMPTQWTYPAYDVFQVEDYDFVTEGAWAQRKQALAAVESQLGYGVADSHYFAGFVLNTEDADLWQNIDRAAEDGFDRNYADVFVWAYPQVQRDGYTFFQTGESDPMSFHDVLFPIEIGFGAISRPTYSTNIIETASGAEQRNSLWAYPKMEFDAGEGVRSVPDVKALLSFFHARKGRAHGFRFRDCFDHSTASDVAAISATDQSLGVGDGEESEFELIKTYDTLGTRRITRPVAATIKVALDGVEQASGWQLDAARGTVQFDTPPGAGVAISAGFEFDVPVRFASDRLDISLATFEAGQVPNVTLVEIIDDRNA